MLTAVMITSLQLVITLRLMMKTEPDEFKKNNKIEVVEEIRPQYSETKIIMRNRKSKAP